MDVLSILMSYRIAKHLIHIKMETTLKIRSKHCEDVGAMKSNATFNDGVELIYKIYNGKIEVCGFRYLNGKDANLYISLLTNEQK